MATKYLDKIGLAYFWSKIKAWCNSLFALDSAVVHKTGNETINGIKVINHSQARPETETDSSTVFEHTAGLYYKSLDITKNEIPEANKYLGITFIDKNLTFPTVETQHSSYLGLVEYSDRATGANDMKLVCYDRSMTTQPSSLNSAALYVGFDENNIKYASCPNTSTERTNSNDIVTRDFIANDSRIVHSTGNELINGIKTFSNSYAYTDLLSLSNNRISALWISSPNITKGTLPEYMMFASLLFLDSNAEDFNYANRLGILEYQANPNNIGNYNGSMILKSYKLVPNDGDAANDNSYLEVGFDRDDIKYAKTVSTSENRIDGQDIVTRDWIPKDTRIVHTTGAETISGVKTFNDRIEINTPHLDTIHFNYTNALVIPSTFPTGTVYRGYSIRDGAGRTLVDCYHRISSTNHAKVWQMHNLSATDATAQFAFTYDNSTNKFYLSGPAQFDTDDDSVKIPNTAWIRDATGDFACNAATATKLTTARTLWGQSFDGSANVTGTLSAVDGITFNDKTGTDTVNIAYGKIATTDYFRIQAGGTAANAGYLEIATADDGNEPVYIRQYRGVFSTISRELVLLGGDGNTYFPGSIRLKNNNITKGTPPADNTWWNLQFTDVNNVEMGGVQYGYMANGDSYIRIGAKKSDTTDYYGLYIGFEESTGDSYARCPSFNFKGINSTDIVTRSWLYSHSNPSTIYPSCDLNDMVYPGTYYLKNGGGWVNLPSGWVNGTLRVYADASQIHVKQIIYRFGTLNSTDYQTCIRTKGLNSAWSNWTEYAIVGHTHSYLPLSGGTMTGTLTISKDNSTINSPAILMSSNNHNYIINAIDTSVTKGTAPSTNRYWGISFYGKDYNHYNQRIGLIETQLLTNNTAKTSIFAYNCTTNANSNTCAIRAIVDGEGNAYTEAPKPSNTADNSTKIATTSWIRTATGNTALNAATATDLASGSVLSVAKGGTGLTSLDTFIRTTGNQTVAGTKTFSSEIVINKGDKPAAGALSHVFGVIYQNTDGTRTHTAHPISVIGTNNTVNSYNTGVRLGSLNGMTVVSAGESSETFCSTLSKFDDENLYLNADGEVHVYVRCSNDMATYAGPIKFSGSGDANGGTTSITATTFIGALTGNVTGNVSGSSGSCTGNAATATKTTATIAVDTTGELVRAIMGSNDVFRIAVGGALNAGWAEIATGDDYNEPIYVRQYQGSFTTLKRTATLLDASGNTDFPGIVTATGFSGSLVESIGSSPSSIFINNKFAKGTYPSTASVSAIYFCDNTNTDRKLDAKYQSGYLTNSVFSSGLNVLTAGVYPNTLNSTDQYGIVIEINAQNVSDIRPNRNNVLSCGTGSYKWTQIYANTSTISTSDERLKRCINYIPDEILDVWEDIEFNQYKFIDAVQEKGVNNARIHSGLIAQHIKAAFEAKDIDITKYAFFCHDLWDETKEERNENGDILCDYKAAGDAYAIRYEEALCIEAAYQRRKNKILENRISELEKQVSDMIILLQNLTNSNG